MNDIRRDWQSWSRIEQATVTLAAVVSLLIVALAMV